MLLAESISHTGPNVPPPTVGQPVLPLPQKGPVNLTRWSSRLPGVQRRSALSPQAQKAEPGGVHVEQPIDSKDEESDFELAGDAANVRAPLPAPAKGVTGSEGLSG